MDKRWAVGQGRYALIWPSASFTPRKDKVEQIRKQKP